MTVRDAAHKAMDAYLDAGGPPDFVIMSSEDLARNSAPMSEVHMTNLIEIGVDLGVFSVVNILLEGATFERQLLQELSDLCAKHIEDVSGMPAEDFALKVQPSIDAILKSARERN